MPGAAPVSPTAPAREDAGSARDDWGWGFGLEWAQADTITVDLLQAITVEANELQSPDIERVRHYPTTKDTRFLRLEGHLIEGKTLITHHVRARVIRAKRIVAHRIVRPKSTYRWSSGRDEPEPVRNRVVRVVAGVSTDAATPTR